MPAHTLWRLGGDEPDEASPAKGVTVGAGSAAAPEPRPPVSQAASTALASGAPIPPAGAIPEPATTAPAKPAIPAGGSTMYPVLQTPSWWSTDPNRKKPKLG
jgi:hypothetical protein